MQQPSNEPLPKWLEDFLGDLAHDTHGIWELFQFARLHDPKASIDVVFQEALKGIEILRDRGLARIANKPLHPSSIATWDDLMTWLRSQGATLADGKYRENAPSLNLSGWDPL